MTNKSDIDELARDVASRSEHIQEREVESVIGMNNTFKAGDQVEYNSTRGWISAKVVSVSRVGFVNLDIKRCVEPTKIRYKKDSDPLLRLKHLRETREKFENIIIKDGAKNTARSNLSVQYARWRTLDNMPSTSEIEEAELLAKPCEWPLLDGIRAQCILCDEPVRITEFQSKKERREWSISKTCGPCQREFLFNDTTNLDVQLPDTSMTDLDPLED